jgi:hypothetical protein
MHFELYGCQQPLRLRLGPCPRIDKPIAAPPLGFNEQARQADTFLALQNGFHFPMEQGLASLRRTQAVGYICLVKPIECIRRALAGICLGFAIQFSI